jgi:acetyl esterase/lipase
MHRRFISLLALLVLPLGVVLLRAQPARSPVPSEHDLEFGKGGDIELKLDLARPAQGDGPFPAVVCVHGGSWKGGKRQDLARTIEVLAQHGYVAAAIDYRLSKQASFPAPLEDCKAAVRWLRANAKTYKINPDRIGAVGFSAGGHLVCLLGTTRKADGLEGKGGNADQSSQVQAVVSFFGPTDFTKKTWPDDLEKSTLAPMVGGRYADNPDLYKKASPITYVTKEAPPFLFFHGTEDWVVAIRHSRVLAEKLEAAGVSAQVITVEGEGHGWHGQKLLKSFNQMVDFLDRELKK